MTQKNSEKVNKNRKKARSPVRSSLTRLEHVREEMASVYREARRGVLDVQDAGKLCYILQNLGRIIETSDLEQRIKALEEAKALE